MCHRHKILIMFIRQIIFFFSFIVVSYNSKAQIDSLSKGSNYVKHLTLEDTFFGNEDMYQVCYPKDHRSMFYFIIIFSLTSIVLAALVIYVKHNANKKLKEKNTIIAEQNKDLLDSINYAQHIQNAILPDSKTLEDLFKNGFVFYKPKNIVSGDFYWIHKCHDLLFVAVIDCTGHGVPGALLTMLGYNAINKAVTEKELTDPTQILDSMNSDVKQALKQTQYQSVQDSMEVAIVCIDEAHRTIKYSGANMSLTLVHNGNLQVINSGKCSVGSVQSQVIELPKTHTINLKQGDAFYLYSDGFADQFGGPKGKKFKYKQLEELLLVNHTKPLQHQEATLSNVFTEWKGSLEQVDDVTVLGYKFN